MKRKVIFLLGLVLIVVAVIFLVKTLGGGGPKIGELRVDSTPTTTIFLDNKNIGRSPYTDKITAGSYTIKLTPDATTTPLVPWEGQIVIGPNLLTYVNADLSDSELSTAVDILWLEKITSKNAELSVTTNPDGASVLIDDVSRGVTPLSLSDISAGDHTVTVTSIGFLTRTLKIKMNPGFKLIVTMKLGLSSGGQQVASPSAVLTPTGKITPTPKTATSSGSSQEDPERPFITIKDTPTGFLRVRMEPSTGATEAARVNPGDKFHIEDTQNGWYQISYDGTNLGWVSGTYAQTTE